MRLGHRGCLISRRLDSLMVTAYSCFISNKPWDLGSSIMIVEVLGLPPRAVRQDLRAPQLLSLGFTYRMDRRFCLGQIPATSITLKDAKFSVLRVHLRGEDNQTYLYGSTRIARHRSDSKIANIVVATV